MALADGGNTTPQFSWTAPAPNADLGAMQAEATRPQPPRMADTISAPHPAPINVEAEVQQAFGKLGTIGRDAAGNYTVTLLNGTPASALLKPYARDPNAPGNPDASRAVTPAQFERLNQAMGGDATPTIDITRNKDGVITLVIPPSEVATALPGALVQETNAMFAHVNQSSRVKFGPSEAPGVDASAVAAAPAHPTGLTRSVGGPASEPAHAAPKPTVPPHTPAAAPTGHAASTPPTPTHAAPSQTAGFKPGTEQNFKAAISDPKSVSAIQARLEAAGYDCGPHHVDGKLGPNTTAALNKMCQEAGIDPAQLTARPGNPELVAKMDSHLAGKANERQTQLAARSDGRHDRDAHQTAPTTQHAERESRRDHGSYPTAPHEPSSAGVPMAQGFTKGAGAGLRA